MMSEPRENSPQARQLIRDKFSPVPGVPEFSSGLPVNIGKFDTTPGKWRVRIDMPFPNDPPTSPSQSAEYHEITGEGPFTTAKRELTRIKPSDPTTWYPDVFYTSRVGGISYDPDGVRSRMGVFLGPTYGLRKELAHINYGPGLVRLSYPSPHQTVREMARQTPANELMRDIALHHMGEPIPSPDRFTLSFSSFDPFNWGKLTINYNNGASSETLKNLEFGKTILIPGIPHLQIRVFDEGALYKVVKTDTRDGSRIETSFPQSPDLSKMLDDMRQDDWDTAYRTYPVTASLFDAEDREPVLTLG